MTLFDWYKSKRDAKTDAKILATKEAVRLNKEKEAKVAKEKEIDKKYKNALNEVIIFAGSIAEYENFKGYEPGSVVACDTGNTEQEIFIRQNNLYGYRFVNNHNNQLRNKLIDDGLEALVNAKPILYDQHFTRYGLPVKKVK